MARTASPWRTVDARFLVGTTAVGLLGVLAAWLATSATARVADQIPWVNVGAAGVLVIAAANYRWLTHGRRAISVRERRVRAELEQALDLDRTVGVAAHGPAVLVAGPGMTRYHRGDCPVVAGKAVQAKTPAAHERAGRRPCEMCRP